MELDDSCGKRVEWTSFKGGTQEENGYREVLPGRRKIERGFCNIVLMVCLGRRKKTIAL